MEVDGDTLGLFAHAKRNIGGVRGSHLYSNNARRLNVLRFGIPTRQRWVDPVTLTLEALICMYSIIVVLSTQPPHAHHQRGKQPAIRRATSATAVSLLDCLTALHINSPTPTEHAVSVQQCTHVTVWRRGKTSFLPAHTKLNQHVTRVSSKNRVYS